MGKQKVILMQVLLVMSFGIWQSTLALPQNKAQTDQFFDAIRVLDFESAKNIAHEIDGASKLGCFNDFVLLYSNEANTATLQFDQCDNQNTNHKILLQLAKGFQELQAEKGSTVNAFKAYSEAIQSASRDKDQNALKISIISMLNLLRKQIFLGTDKYKPYMDHYKELKLDNTDRIYLALYDVVFNTKENSNYRTSADYNKNIDLLDSIFEHLPPDHPLRPRYFFEKSIQFKVKGDYDTAIQNLSQANVLTVGQPFFKDLHHSVLWQLASNYFLLDDLKNAGLYLQKAKAAAITQRHEFFDTRLQAWIFHKRKSFDSAYYYLNKSLEIEYKMDAKGNSLESSLLAIENQTDKLKLDNIISEGKRKASRNWLIAACFVLVAGASFATLLHKNTTKKRLLAEKDALLKQERVNNLLKQQELLSIDAMIAGQEKERQRVANELHDDLGSLMATIKLHFDKANENQNKTALKQAQKLLEEAYQKVRGMAHRKNSGVMGDQGLVPAIQKMAEVISGTNALQVHVEAFGMGERLENSLELNLFRMVQELVANVVKHAQATQVGIQLTQHDDHLNIIVEDDGGGFDRAQLNPTTRGMGLTNIEKRVEHLEGSFTIDSVLGKGTSILIDIPV